MRKRRMELGLIAVFLVLMLFIPSANAATYYSIRPGDEVCTSIIFGLNGGGEYTLVADYPEEGRGDPWIDNHFTSLIAGPNNIISVPMCFSAIDRSLSDEQNIKAVVTTPKGNVTYYYGICVAKYGDVDITDGPATGSPCEVMGENTDIFSAGLLQPEMYAQPGSTATFTLVLDASTPLSVNIAKYSGDLSIMASESSLSLGPEQQEVQIKVNAPSAQGDYPFTLRVSVEDCSISDCTRDVKGVLRVATASDTPQSSLFIWLTPETKSVTGQQGTQFMIRVQNYGEGQEVTVITATDEGLETNFEPYSIFLKKGESKSIPLSVRPATDERRSYEVTAIIEGADGTKRSAKSWLTVDEMVADASKMGQEGFIDDYDSEGGATVEDWEELESATGNVIYDDDGFTYDDESEAPDYTIYIIIAVVAVVAAVSILLVYRKMQVREESGTTWEDLGLK